MVRGGAGRRLGRDSIRGGIPLGGLRLLALGCGDAFSNRWYSSCFALEAEGTWLLVDCPHPIRKILREAGESMGLSLDVGDFAGLALTHLHADHASGVEGWAFYSHFHLEKRAVLAAHPMVSGPLWDRQLAESMAPSAPPKNPDHIDRDFYFDIRDLSEEAETVIGPFRIECRRTCHTVPTFALRIRAGGRTLAHSADTAFDPDLIAWLSTADLVIHETNHDPHTPYEKLAALPGSIRSKMRLIHYPDDFDLEGSAIEPLRQGNVYEV